MKGKPIVVTGACGQLALSIKERWASFSRADEFELVCKDKKQLDITSKGSIEKTFNRQKVSVLINTAAYTSVDEAESEQDQAYLLNHVGSQNLASYSLKSNFKLIHISTDFVFSGKKAEPYLTTDLTDPPNVYGKSKRAGEAAIFRMNPRLSTVIRTSWLYSKHRNNFVRSMIRLMSERESLHIVNDQIGSPTSTDSLVDLIFTMLKTEDYSGIYHWSDRGSVSWYDFALVIQDYCLDTGLLKKRIPIIPISTNQYPTSARRPKYSVMDSSLTIEKYSIEPKPWKESLKQVIERIAGNEK